MVKEGYVLGLLRDGFVSQKRCHKRDNCVRKGVGKAWLGGVRKSALKGHLKQLGQKGSSKGLGQGFRPA